MSPCQMIGEVFLNNKAVVQAPSGIPGALITVFLGPRKPLDTCADTAIDRSVGAC